MRIWGSQWSHFPRHRSVFCFRFSVKLSDLVSSPIDSFFPSFRIHGIVVINYLHRLHRLLHRLQRLQSSPESSSALCRS